MIKAIIFDMDGVLIENSAPEMISHFAGSLGVDEENFYDASATDIGQRCDDNLLLIQQFLDSTPLSIAAFSVLAALDDRQVVVKGLHVRVQFGLDIPGQITDVLVAQRNRRPGDENLSVVAPLLQGGSQGEKGFAGAGFAGDRYQGHICIS